MSEKEHFNMVVSGKVRTCQATLEHVYGLYSLRMLMDESACHLDNLPSLDDVEKFLAA